MYKHGIEVTEKQTANVRPLSTSYGVQVIVGTAPIHLTAHPEQAVNKPILLNSWEEAKEKLGYSERWNLYTLCQSMYASWKLFQVYPAVFINVLDPERHSKDSESKNIQIHFIMEKVPNLMDGKARPTQRQHHRILGILQNLVIHPNMLAQCRK